MPGALAEAVKGGKKAASAEKAEKPAVVNVNTDQPMKRRGNPNIGNLRKAEKQPKFAPDGREIPEGFSYKKRTGEISPVVKREQPVERRTPAQIEADLVKLKDKIMEDAVTRVAKIDERLAKLHERSEQQIEVEKALAEGKTPEQLQAEADEALAKVRQLKKVLKRINK